MDEMVFGEMESGMTPPQQPRRWPIVLGIILGLAMIPMGFYCSEKIQQNSKMAVAPHKFAPRMSPVRAINEVVVHESVSIDDDGNMKDENEMIWGTWVMNYYGPRYLEINPDHTARLVSFPDMLAQMVLGTKRLDIDCVWTREGNRIHFKLAEGAPDEAFDYVLKTWGNTLPYEFVSVSSETLTFKDLSDGKTDVWSRADSIPTLHQANKPTES